MSKLKLSRRLVKMQAAAIEKTLEQVNADAGYARRSNYIYRAIQHGERVYLSTVNRFAAALKCSPLDILEEEEG